MRCIEVCEPVTEAQRKFIRDIEKYYGCEFNGYTKTQAQKWLSEWVTKYKDDMELDAFARNATIDARRDW